CSTLGFTSNARATLRIPRDGDQRSELMAITIPKSLVSGYFSGDRNKASCTNGMQPPSSGTI
ncbi:MAG: hypothetical protein WAL45_07730, partial [Terracidiphilus sp.]